MQFIYLFFLFHNHNWLLDVPSDACKRDLWLDNGNLKYEVTPTTPRYELNVYFTCNDGYKLYGKQRLQCVKDELYGSLQWDGQISACRGTK